MNDRDRVRYEACKRSAQIGKDYVALVPPASIFSQKFADLDAKVTEFENSTGAHDAAVGTAAQKFDLKGLGREDLIDLMTLIANAARAAEPDNPGTQARFRFNRALSDADLLAAANNFLAASPADITLLTDWGAPTGWHLQLNSAKTAFDTGYNAAASAQDAKVGLTAQQRDLLDQAMQIKRTLGHMVPNYFAADIAAFTAWTSAAHVEVLNGNKPTPPTP
ncbi:MAG: hypothetical protein JO314_11625 [Acidobacteria bacterium]|nr:hypothetical protein [Acidobacteriota bacterium]